MRRVGIVIFQYLRILFIAPHDVIGCGGVTCGSTGRKASSLLERLQLNLLIFLDQTHRSKFINILRPIDIMFVVINEKCRKVGSALAGIRMRDDAFLSLAPELGDEVVRSLIFLYVSAICHQTETLKGNLAGQQQRGWDYLMGKFVETGRTCPRVLAPDSIKDITAEDLQSIVSDSGDASTSTLSRAEERAYFLRDVARLLITDYESNPIFLYGNGTLGGNSGLYSRMTQFSAFGEDPMMEKATVYFMLMQKSGLWQPFNDPQELRPMPDYHKMRLFLRTGCIKCNDREVDKKLKAKIRQEVTVDNELWGATAEAYRKILEYSEKDFFELEVLLWSFTRSFCYHSTLCISGTGQGNFHKYTDVGYVSTCPLEGICEKEIGYWHPIVDTHFH
jgi:hypothetical protein